MFQTIPVVFVMFQTIPILFVMFQTIPILFVMFQPCSPKHPQFAVVSQLCDSAGINDTHTKYRWRVAAPNGVTSKLTDLETNTFFTVTRVITLDSIYFEGGRYFLA